MLRILMSSIMFLIFGPMLLQLGAEKEGREELVRSLLSLLMVCLELGSCGGRGVYSSNQGGGVVEWEEGGTRRIFVMTGIERVR